MCGINLLLHPRASKERLELMQRALLHRGPDTQGHCRLTWGEETLWMGATRLKVQGLSNAANQPLQCNPGGMPGTRYSLCFNGEIYNQYELRNELLSQGFRFQTQSDAELLLYGLSYWGKSLLPRLNGMFALAFFDAETGRLLLARDRQGMKPLYYARHEGGLLVASEIRGILASGLLNKKLNEAQILHYLHFRYARPPHTFFEGIQQLPAGHLLELHNPRHEAEPECWLPPAEALNPAGEDWPAQLEELLTDALLSQLQADRPQALLLSGGVDSTLMLALLRKQGANLPLCFGIGTDTQSASAVRNTDLYWAEKAALQYEAPFQPVRLTADILSGFESFVSRLDQPIADSAALLSDQVCAAIKQSGRVVVLSGSGADDYFAGYNRHTAWQGYLKNPRAWAKAARYLNPLLAFVPSALPGRGKEKIRLMKRYLESLDADVQQTFANMLSLQPPAPRHLFSPLEAEGNSADAWLAAALRHDQKHYLAQDLLALNDNLGMQHSLEMRMPYLDTSLVRWAAQQNPAWFLQEGRKWTLKKLLAAEGGAAYANRQKQGFSLPFGYWLKQGKGNELWQWLKEPGCPAFHYLPYEKVKHSLAQHRQGKTEAGEWLFGVAVLAAWLNQQFS